MANLGEHLNATFQKAGLELDNPALKELVTKAATIDIADELVTRFDSAFLTLEAAKNNPTVINHVKAQVYNGEDRAHETLMDKYQFDDETKNSLKAEKSTPKRREMLIDKIAELKEKKQGAGSGEKAQLTEQINLLNAELVKYKSTYVPKSELESKEKEFNDSLTNLYMDRILSSKNYANERDKAEDYLLPKTWIQKALVEKGYRVTLDNKNLKLETKDGLEVYDNSIKVDFNGFTEKVLAQNNSLAASNPAEQKTTVITPNTNNVNNSKFMQRVEELQSQAKL